MNTTLVAETKVMSLRDNGKDQQHLTSPLPRRSIGRRIFQKSRTGGVRKSSRCSRPEKTRPLFHKSSNHAFSRSNDGSVNVVMAHRSTLVKLAFVQFKLPKFCSTSVSKTLACNLRSEYRRTEMPLDVSCITHGRKFLVGPDKACSRSSSTRTSSSGRSRFASMILCVTSSKSKVKATT